jgi:hypothetical protein
LKELARSDLEGLDVGHLQRHRIFLWNDGGSGKRPVNRYIREKHGDAMDHQSDNKCGRATEKVITNKCILYWDVSPDGTKRHNSEGMMRFNEKLIKWPPQEQE